MTDRLEAFDARLRENERVTALQGQTLSILAADAKLHASAEVVAALEDLTRNGLVPDVAVLKAQMNNPQSPSGLLEQAWSFFVGLGLQVAEFLGLRRRPWLALVYILLGLTVWGVRSVYLDREARDLLLRTIDRQERVLRAIESDVEGVEAGVDSLVSGAAPE